MFGLLIIFGQLWDEPWYGKNTGLLQGLSTSPHHIQLTGRHFLSVPGPIAAQRHTGAALNVGDKPQRACRRHDQTTCVGAHDAVPFTALFLPQTIEGIGIADGNFHGPAVAILAQDGVDAQGESSSEKRLDRRERFALPRRVEAARSSAPHNDDPGGVVRATRSATARTRRAPRPPLHSGAVPNLWRSWPGS